MGERVRYERGDGVATIAMDDGKVNVMSLGMQAELHDALDRAEADGAAVVIAGRPGVLSAGFDLQVLQGGGTDAVDMVIGGFELAARVLAFPRPVIVACTGHAIAMGAFLLLSGDHRVGADGAYKYVANEVAIGLTMPRPALAILRQRLTPAAFERAAVLAEPFDPSAALAAGFLDEVVPADEVVARATERARLATALDPTAHAATKQRARAATLDAIARGIELDRAELVPA